MEKSINKKLQDYVLKDRKDLIEYTEDVDSNELENDIRNIIMKNYKIKTLYTNLAKKSVNNQNQYELKISFITEN